MPWVLISIVAIVAWALVEMNKSRGAGGDFRRVLADLTGRLEASEAERARLVTRVENLEAIVTSEPYELERAARQALPPAALNVAEGDAAESTMIESDEAQAARLAQRVRGG